ncbi:hypothetical protein VSR01_27885 [Actinacidiphila sp. DG2A-62]|uniref:hypothetical protein n=1 Tax=Actinacidiphila sp. DG2A-62 TaxID=3108821 RepID=UPI002DC00465|nr:hypothetical protein [Actinacidiphila sp. DG2A-62]MEC3997114.1 hypothetical protein [Actinacidiphila sp. DG2A-62]
MPAPDPKAPLSEAPHLRSRDDPGGLRAFSDALARRLPGSWSAFTKDYFRYSHMYADVRDSLWDRGQTTRVLQDRVPDRAALLNGPGGESLVVIERPRHPGQFLVAALAPPGVYSVLRNRYTPHGIAVPEHPARAAADVGRRLLPRYRQAVDAVRVPALHAAHLRAEKALTDWDDVSDSLCDEHGVPLDFDAYGTRKAQRDAAAWAGFDTFLFHGEAAIGHATRALASLPLPAATVDRWSRELRALSGALAEGTDIRDIWQTRLDFVLDHHNDPDRWHTYSDTRHTRNAEAWHVITAFIDHGGVLHAIANAEREHTQAAAAHTTATVPAPPSAPAGRRPR